MAISEINAALDIISKLATALGKIKNQYSQVTEEIHAFPQKVKIYREKVSQWEQLLSKYPLPPDHSVIARVNEAVNVLEKEVQHVQAIEKSNSCCRFWHKTWSSESLITSLTGVENAFNNISVSLQQRQQAEQAVEQEADKFTTPFSFARDKKYVPIEKTFKKLCRVLESDGSSPKVVLLHGGSGEGKSTMVKFIALHYDYEKTKGASSSSNSCRFSDGVIFLSCGKTADSLSLMRQLSVDLGYSHDASQARDQMDGSDRERELELLKKRLLHRLKNRRRVLIIVDDVWDQQLISALMMPLQDITYLITSQLNTIWQDSDECLSIDSPSVEEARQILANHIVGWNCKPLPPKVQGEVDHLIEKVQSHPLVLANIAALIKCEQVPHLETWIQLRKELMNAIQRADQSNAVSKPTVFGKPYELKLVASLTMAINLIVDDAKSLLFMLAMCTGLGVDEKILRLWFKVLHGSSMYMFNFAYADLRERSLISIVETKSPGMEEARITCSIHDLRRELIREKNEGVLEDTLQKLIGQGTASSTKAQVSSYESEEDLAAALCFVHADVKYTRKAQSRIPIYKFLLESGNDSWYRKSILNFVHTLAQFLHPSLEDACDGEKATHELARTVILHYLQFDELKDEAVSKLLDIPEAYSATLSALTVLPFDKSPRSIPMTIRIFVKALGDRADVLPEFPGDISIALKVLSNHFSDGLDSLGWILLKEPDLRNALGKIFQWSVSSSISNDAHADITLPLLSCLERLSSSRATRIEVATVPGMLETLLQFLGSNLHTNKSLLQPGAKLFLKMACSDTDVKANTIRLPGVFKTLVGLLPHTPDMAFEALEKLAWTRRSARLVASYPRALKGLLELLTDSSHLPVQCKAVHCLGVISSFRGVGSIIAATCPTVFQSLIHLAHQDSSPELLAHIAIAVQKIISGDPWFEVGMSQKILTEVLQRLYLLLADDDVFGALRSRAVDALETLVLEEATRGDFEAYPGLPEQLIKVFPRTVREDRSMKTISIALKMIFMEGKDMEESRRMALVAGAVKMYTTMLQDDTIGSVIQREAAKRLGTIFRNQEFLKIMVDVGAERIIINHMKKHPRFFLSEEGTHVIERIIFEGANLTNLERSFLVIEVFEFYVNILRDDYKILVEDAVQGVSILAYWEEIRKLLIESDLQFLLVHVTERASPSILKHVAKIIHRVCCIEWDEIQRTSLLIKTLEKYVALLGSRIEVEVTEAAVKGLMILGSGEEMSKIILADGGVMDLFLGLLTKHKTWKTLEHVTCLLQNILVKGSKLEKTQRKIVFMDRAVGSFVMLFRDGMKRSRIVRAFGILAFKHENGRIRVAYLEAVNQLTRILRKVEVRDILLDYGVEGVVELASACELDGEEWNEDMLGLRSYFLQRCMSIIEDDTNTKRGRAMVCLYRILAYETNRKLFASACPRGQASLSRYLDRQYGIDLRDATIAFTLVDPIKARAMTPLGYKFFLGRGLARVILKQYKHALEDFDSALEDFDKASQLDSELEVKMILRLKRFTKVQLRDFVGALEDWSQEIFMDDGFEVALALRERGILKYMMQDYNEALLDLNESLRIFPDDYEALKHRGYVKFCLGDENGARFDAQQALCTHFIACKFPTCSYFSGDYMCYLPNPYLGNAIVKYLEFELKKGTTKIDSVKLHDMEP